MQIYRTRDGDTLDSIVFEYYGSLTPELLAAVYAANPNISDHIQPFGQGLQIHLPDADISEDGEVEQIKLTTGDGGFSFEDIVSILGLLEKFDISTLGEETSVVDGDWLAIYDVSVAGMRKVTRENFLGDLGFSIYDLTSALLDVSDSIAFSDSSETGNPNRRAFISDILALVEDFSITALTTAVPTISDFLAFSDESETGAPVHKATIHDVLQLASQASFAISGLTDATIASTDYLPFSDTSDSGTNKKELVSNLLSLFTVHGQATGIPAVDDFLLFSDESETDDPNRKATVSSVLALLSSVVFGTPTDTQVIGWDATNSRMAWNNASNFSGVYHDSTLTGTGASDTNVLSVVNALTDADKTKLDSVFSGAEPNFRQVVAFSAVDGDATGSLDAAEIGFYESLLEVQSGDLSDANRIYIPLSAATYGADASDANTNKSAVNLETRSLFDAVIAVGGSFLLQCAVRGTTETAYCRAEDVSVYSQGGAKKGWVLTELSWSGATIAMQGEGRSWNITVSISVPVVADAILDNVSFDIDALTAETAPVMTDFLAFYDVSASDLRKVTLANLLKKYSVNSWTAETAIADSDFVGFYDVSAAVMRKITLSNLLSGISGSAWKVSDLTAATPETGDYLVFSDESETEDPNRKATIATILALASQAAFDINALTAETTVSDSDTVAIYDASASAQRKVTYANFLSDIPWAIQASAPGSPFDGQGWYDTTSNILKIYDSTGADWFIASAFNHADFPTGAAALSDTLAFVDVSDSDKTKKDTISDILALGDFVKTRDLEGHEEDLYGSFQQDFLQSDVNERRSGFIFTTDSSGAPTDANALAQIASVDDGTYCIALSTVLQTNSDADQIVPDYDTAKSAADYPVGKVFYIHSQVPYDTKNYMKCTITTAGVLVGTGTAAYIYFYATVDEVETFANGDYFRISDLEPSDLDIDIPVSAINNLSAGITTAFRDALKVSGSPTLTQTTRLFLDTFESVTISHLNEHLIPKTTAPINISGTFETTLNDISGKNSKIGFQNPLHNGVAQIRWALPDNVSVIGGGTVPVSDVENYFDQHHKFIMTSGVKVFQGIAQNFVKVFGIYYVNVGSDSDPATLVGTFADGDSVTIRLQSQLVKRDEFSDIALADFDWDDIVAATPVGGDSLLFWDDSASAVRRSTVDTLLSSVSPSLTNGLQVTGSDQDLITGISAGDVYEIVFIGSKSSLDSGNEFVDSIVFPWDKIAAGTFRAAPAFTSRLAGSNDGVLAGNELIVFTKDTTDNKIKVRFNTTAWSGVTLTLYYYQVFR